MCLLRNGIHACALVSRDANEIWAVASFPWIILSGCKFSGIISAVAAGTLRRGRERAMRANVFHRIEHGAGVANDEWWTVSDHNLTPRLAAIDAYVEPQLITWRGLFKFASNLRSPFAKIIFRCLRTAYSVCAYVGANCRIWWTLCECVRFISADRIARRTYSNGPDVRLSSHKRARYSSSQ